MFLQVHTDEGVTGNGQPYSIGPDEAIVATIDAMNPWFVGQDPSRIEWLLRRAKNTMRFPLGQVAWSALSGIDHALWDIAGKVAGEPVYSLFGGPTRDRVRVYHGTHGDSPESLVERALELGDEGYSAFKTSPFPPNWPELPWGQVLREAEARISALRDAVGDSAGIAIDIHVKIREPARALELVNVLTPYRLMFVEEPARAEYIGSTARLRQEFRVALATGENLYGIARYAELLDAEAVDIIQPDLLCLRRPAGGEEDSRHRRGALRNGGASQSPRPAVDRHGRAPGRKHPQLHDPGVGFRSQAEESRIRG